MKTLGLSLAIAILSSITFAQTVIPPMGPAIPSGTITQPTVGNAGVNPVMSPRNQLPATPSLLPGNNDGMNSNLPSNPGQNDSDVSKIQTHSGVQSP